MRNVVMQCIMMIYCLPLLSSVGGDDVFTAYAVDAACAIPCHLVYTPQSNLTRGVMQKLAYDLSFSDQLAVDLGSFDDLHKMRDFSIELAQSMACVVSCNFQADAKNKLLTIAVVVRSDSGEKPLLSRQYTIKMDHLHESIHRIARDILICLTGEAGVVEQSLVYCKQKSPQEKIICTADYCGGNEKVVVSGNGICTVPVWHTRAPELFYSRFTTRNLELCSFNIQSGKNRVVCSYDGMNLLPSFSQDGKDVVLCLSKTGNSELYMQDHEETKKNKKVTFRQLTDNKGSNGSPCLLPTGDVIFCSDFEHEGICQIYLFKQADASTKRLTNGQGYCAAPSYSAVNDDVVYLRSVDGVLQLFSLSLKSSGCHEQQITFDLMNKYEPAYSSCGQYILFSCDVQDKDRQVVRQIGVLNRASKRIRILTRGKMNKSFPSWTHKPLSRS